MYAYNYALKLTDLQNPNKVIQTQVQTFKAVSTVSFKIEIYQNAPAQISASYVENRIVLKGLANYRIFDIKFSDIIGMNTSPPTLMNGDIEFQVERYALAALFKEKGSDHIMQLTNIDKIDSISIYRSDYYGYRQITPEGGKITKELIKTLSESLHIVYNIHCSHSQQILLDLYMALINKIEFIIRDGDSHLKIYDSSAKIIFDITKHADEKNIEEIDAMIEEYDNQQRFKDESDNEDMLLSSNF